MNKKIFRSTMLVALLVLFSGVMLVLGILLDFFEQQIHNELINEAVYISHAIENQGEAFLDNLKSADKRIMLFTPSGELLADTSDDEPSSDVVLPYVDFEEAKDIRDAIADGTGISHSYSGTRTEKTLYYSTRLHNGNILRISTTNYSAITILLGLMQPLVFVLVIAFILSSVLAYRISNSIVKPINALNLDAPVASNDTYEELAPLLRKIAAQNRTIQRRIKEAGRRQEEFRLITENMSEGFITTDESGNILTYNTAVLRLLNISNPIAENILKLNCSDEFHEAALSALDGERSERALKVGDRTYTLIANPVAENDKTIGAIIIMFDITEKFRQELIRREFTSNVSHELKTPLTSISGFAEILKSGMTDSETVVDFSSSIYDEAQRLITLVSDIIKLSELDEGSVHIEKEDVDLFELSEEIVLRLLPAAKRSNISISVAGETSYVFGARKILDEMIHNLCDNAIKYNFPGGYVRVFVKRENDAVMLSVSDNGIGIPPEEQTRIFERFYRVDKSHSKEVGGTGLGLSIVKHAAIYHDAKISLRSSVGKGTEISVTFIGK